jgi:hypothetical protein
MYVAVKGDLLRLVLTFWLVQSYGLTVCVVVRVVVFDSRAMMSSVAAVGRKVRNPTCLHVCNDWHSAILDFYTTFLMRPKLDSEPPD